MTYEMKHKPIKEGFKFFALNDAMTGYCFVVFPAGKLDKKKGQTWDIVEKLIKHLPGRRDRKYVACMDNWFTWPKTIMACTDHNVATVGTARNPALPFEINEAAEKKKGKDKDGKQIVRPPRSKVTDKRYNTLHVMDHKLGYRCFRWVDNSVVKFVSNLHYGTGNEAVLRPRKKPRLKEARDLWEKNVTLDVEIPQMVNDYNFWMKGKFLVEFVLKCRVMQNSDILSSSNYAVILD